MSLVEADPPRRNHFNLGLPSSSSCCFVLFFSFSILFFFFFFFLFLFQFGKENDRFTTPPQQLHNTPSHGDEAQCVWPTPCEEVLCSCCGGVV